MHIYSEVILNEFSGIYHHVNVYRLKTLDNKSQKSVLNLKTNLISYHYVVGMLLSLECGCYAYHCVIYTITSTY